MARAQTPIVAGLGGDVEALRAAFRLAQASGAALDGSDLDGAYSELSVLAASGAMATTPAEARARADLLLLVGRATDHAVTDFTCAGTPPRQAAGTERRVIALGGIRAGAEAMPAPAGLVPTLGLLRAALASRPSARPEHADVARALKGARFGVVLYDPAELGEMGVDMVLGLVRDLNATTRFSSCALVEPAARLVVAVSAWTLGQAPRSGLGRGVPEHDPWRFNAERQVCSGEADTLVWVHPSVPPPPWTRSLPALALLADPRGDEADIVVAVAAPGRDSAGTLWDAERATMTFRPATAPRTDRPAAAVILDALTERVTMERGRPC
ncbi:formyltransferase [Xanthobacter agilis]|uniref:formyltransferase n=1 Tax=Xanthobacter agilis TaxID=47492 RepID=UPI00372CA140